MVSLCAAAFAQGKGNLIPVKDPGPRDADFVIPNCTAQPIDFGQTVNNTIASTDCVGTRGATHRADEYTFTGTAGQQIVVSIVSDNTNNPGGSTIDTYLILRSSNGSVIAFDDDGGTNGGQGFPTVTNSRIPAITGFFTLPSDDTYSIEATTFSGGDFGAYSLTLIDGGRDRCAATMINYSLPPVTHSGQLLTSDCVSRGQFYTDRYAFEGVAGQNVTIDLSSLQFDAYLILRDQAQNILRENNDGGGGTNSRITFTLPTTGLYFIDATTNLENQIGSYSMVMSLNLPSATIPVSVPTVSGTVGGQVTVPVTVGALPTGTGANAVRSFQFVLNYNPAVLRPVNNFSDGADLGINQTGTLSAPFACDTNPQASTPVPNPGAITVGCFGNGTPISGSGTLINLVFDVIGNGGTSSPIILNPFMFNEGNPISYVFTASGGVIVNQYRMTGNVYYYFGTINGEQKPIAAAQVTAAGNPVVQSDSNVRGAYPLEGLSGSGYSVLTRKNGDIPARGATTGLPGQTAPPLSAFDAQLANAFSVGNTTLTLNQQRAADVSGNGIVTSYDAALILQYNNPPQAVIPGNRTGQWKFVNPNGTYDAARIYTTAEVQSNLTNQNWIGILLGDVSGNWTQPCLPPAICTTTPLTEADFDAVSVDIPELTSPANTIVEIPIIVGDVTNRGAVSFDFALLYNPDVLRPATTSPVIQMGTMSQGYTLAYNTPEPGKFRVGAFGLNPLTSFGTLLKIRFEVIGSPGANTELRWENFFFNEGDPATTNTDGTFLVAGRTKFDFDGDGKADNTVFRPSEGNWYMMNSTNGFSVTNWGLSNDLLAPADFDGDGRTDVVVVRQNTWYILRSNGGFVTEDFGLAGDIPMSGDWDGDGKAEVAVYRPSSGSEQGTFYYRGTSNNPSRSITFVRWGSQGDIPVSGDFDGDGKLDAAVFRPSNRVWYILRSSDNQLNTIHFGLSTDKLVPADYDGDGITDVAVYRDGVWYIMKSASGFEVANFGLAGDVPTPADYDGDGKVDVAVFRSGTWHMLGTASGYKAMQFGVGADKPVPAAYLP